jgi:hypothetical protein
MHFVSASCGGVNCAMCLDLDRKKCPATHKVGEEIPDDDPYPIRHNLTAYVCCKHFCQIVGNAATPCDKEGPAAK